MGSMSWIRIEKWVRKVRHNKMHCVIINHNMRNFKEQSSLVLYMLRFLRLPENCLEGWFLSASIKKGWGHLSLPGQTEPNAIWIFLADLNYVTQRFLNHLRRPISPHFAIRNEKRSSCIGQLAPFSTCERNCSQKETIWFILLMPSVQQLPETKS